MPSLTKPQIKFLQALTKATIPTKGPAHLATALFTLIKDLPPGKDTSGGNTNTALSLEAHDLILLRHNREGKGLEACITPAGAAAVSRLELEG